VLGFQRRTELDGSFHELKVAIESKAATPSKRAAAIMRPRAWRTPPPPPGGRSKMPVSREEMNDLPVQLHPVLQSAGDTATVTVLRTWTWPVLKFRKADGRNLTT